MEEISMHNNSNKKLQVNQCSDVNKNLIDYAIHKNLESILGFSMKRTDNRQDAEDLTQDIIIEIYRSYSKLKRYEGVQALEGWMWAIARHTYCRWLNKRKKNNVVYIEGVLNEHFCEGLDDSIGNEFVKEEQLNLLRREISILSKNYRDIIVLYYLNNKTCAEISEITKLPLSTVKWRLHQAKITIRERMENMKTYSEKTYAPGNLWVRSAGTFNDPYSCFYVYDQLKSLLRQNIILSAYRKPIGISELSVELGVPAAYLEEELYCLTEEELIKVKGSEKYQTDFIIITSDIKENIYPILEELGCNMAGYFLNEINNLEESIRRIGFIGCDKPWEELLWSIIPACSYSCFMLLLPDFTPPPKPHGNSWKLIGFEGTKNDYPWSGDIKISSFFEGKFSQGVYWTNNLTYRTGFFDKEEANFYYSCLTGKIDLENLEEKNKEIAAQLISKGFLVKENDIIKPNMISLTEEQYKNFITVVNPSVQYFTENILDKYVERMKTDLKKRVPSELSDDIYFAAGMLITESLGYTLKYLLDKEILKLPEDLTTSVKGMYTKVMEI